MKRQPLASWAVAYLAVSLVAPAAHAETPFHDEMPTPLVPGGCCTDQSDLAPLASLTPAQVRAAMVAFWQKRKESAEWAMKREREDLQRAEDGIRKWSAL